MIQVVDEAVDAAAAHFNLRDTIQEFRLKAEETDDPEKKDSYIEKGTFKNFTLSDEDETNLHE